VINYVTAGEMAKINYVINYVTAGEMAKINYVTNNLCDKLCDCRWDGKSK